MKMVKWGKRKKKNEKNEKKKRQFFFCGLRIQEVQASAAHLMEKAEKCGEGGVEGRKEYKGKGE